MQNKFSLPRGTADILPENIFQWRNAEQIIRNILNIYGYKEICTPLFEETELFARSAGAASDIIQKQMFNLAAQMTAQNEGAQLSGLSLRPEGTASVVRSYIENNMDRKDSLSKLFYYGPMFRGERPQKGRLRQFHQVGVEAIGPGAHNPFLDAEIITLSVHMLKSLGLKDFDLKINTLGSSEDKIKFAKVLKTKLSKNIALLCEDCQIRFEKNILRVLDCKNRSCKGIVNSLEPGTDWLSQESLAFYHQVKQALKDSNVVFTEEPHLVRGLDYYTHTVFEISSRALGSQDALGAGGRYNNLVSQLGGPDVPAVGVALGIERILLALGRNESLNEKLDVFVIPMDEQSFKTAFSFVNNLRERDIQSDISYNVSTLKSQMRRANKLNARLVAIFGENEIKKGTAVIKNMETGKQEELSRDEAVNFIKNELK